MVDSIDDPRWLRHVMSPGGSPILVMLSLTTDSTGVATLDYDYDSLVSVATTTDSVGPTGVYTITLPGAWYVTLCEPIATTDNLAAASVATASSPSAGTITLTFAAAHTSGQISVAILLDPSAP